MDKTRLLNHIVTNIIYRSRGEPRGRPCLHINNHRSIVPGEIGHQRHHLVASMYENPETWRCFTLYDVQRFLLSLPSMAPMLGGNYTLHRKTQARLRNGNMLTLCMKTENSEDWRGKKCFWWVLLSCWFPFETSHCTSRQKSSFLRVKGF